MSNLGYNVIANTDLCCSLPMLSSGEWDAAINRSKKLTKSLSRSLDLAETIISTSTSLFQLFLYYPSSIIPFEVSERHMFNAMFSK